jgi:hypothetical protein
VEKPAFQAAFRTPLQKNPHISCLFRGFPLAFANLLGYSAERPEFREFFQALRGILAAGRDLPITAH